MSWWKDSLIVGPFADLAAANAWAAANPSSLFPGLLATADGVQYRWDGSAWVAAYGGAVGTLYNGTTVPFPTPSASLLGMRIPVVNPEVPRGFSWLECNGTAWVPPAGELIAQYIATPYLAQATPGVQPLYKAWQSDVIPDYMFPDGSTFSVQAAANIKNAAGVAGAHLMCGVSGIDPTGTEAATYPLGIRAFVPQAGGSGFIATIPGWSQRSGAILRSTVWGVNPSSLGAGSAITEVTSTGRACSFVPGSMRAYVKAVTTSEADVVTVNMVQVKAGF